MMVYPAWLASAGSEVLVLCHPCKDLAMLHLL